MYLMSDRKPKYLTVTLFARAFIVQVISTSLRILSFLGTSLPGPAPHCQPNSNNYKPPNTINDIMFRVDLTKGCGDLIYSSHILIAMTAILAVNYYIPILVSSFIYLQCMHFFCH